MKNIIIAGMHRSGTSLITQWLSKCGLNIGEYCMGAGPANLDGHFEDLEFIRLHEDILNDNGLPKTGLTDLPVTTISEYNKRRFENLFQQKDEFFDQWGWKDPRTCLFLNYYKNHFPDSNYLFIIRDHLSVVSSLLHREFKEVNNKYLSRKYLSRFIWLKFRKKKQFEAFCKENAAYYLSIWLTYNIQINRTIQQINPKNYILLSYALLQRKDTDVFQYLCEDWDLDLKFVPFSNVFKKDQISKLINVEQYITDKSLLKKAENLNTQLQVMLLIQDLNLYVN
jgi:hypothetical protein